MANMYRVLKEKHQQEVNDFPIMFAFSNEQFKQGLEELGLTEADTDKIYSIGGGGYIRKTDSKALHEMFDRHEREMKAAIASDSTGEGFILDMFNYELGNHEYCVTYDTSDTLDALGLTSTEVAEDTRLSHGLKKACKNQLENSCW